MLDTITPRPNWLHLDLKGTIPTEPALVAWLEWLADRGFNGIVWEMEDRLPWRSWPGTHRAGYDLASWRRILGHCDRLHLEVVPLVQTQGHLEWLLKHERWADWREGGHWNELCPQHPEARTALQTWLDEVIELHPSSRFVHLGGDETWHLASCPACQAKAEQAPEGRMAVYLEHISRLCEYVAARGVRPMIWADMFWREANPALAAQLPAQTVLVDWQYGGAGPWATTAALPKTHTLLGASAVRSGYEPHHAIAPLQYRVENVLGWHQQMAANDTIAGLIHTTWGRGDSLRPIYGPWEGWLPAFVAAGDPAQWENHPLREAVARLDEAMLAPAWHPPTQTLDYLKALRPQDPFEQQAVEWWCLALRHHIMLQNLVLIAVSYEGFRSVQQHVGVDPDQIRKLQQNRLALLEQMDAWEADARHWWRDNQLSDEDEFIGTKLGNLRRVLPTIAL